MNTEEMNKNQDSLSDNEKKELKVAENYSKFFIIFMIIIAVIAVIFFAIN